MTQLQTKKKTFWIAYPLVQNLLNGATRRNHQGDELQVDPPTIK